jgi:predicted 3-demethylubiquinone-9 3-methyltransferase (glyoxalase superfamily)
MAAQKIAPHLWFDTQAREAAEFYCSVFPDSEIKGAVTLEDTPSGDAESVSFVLWGQDFMAISAGPVFTFNPSISFMVNIGPPHESPENARRLIDTMWNALVEGGSVLMPLDSYPFSERYGWLQDKYGVSWQLILTSEEGDPRPPIIPSLLFVGDNSGKAEEARDFYLSVFRESAPGMLARYPEGMEPDREGTVMFSDYQLLGQWFAAMDSAREHGYSFNEAISLMVRCKDQNEIDYYWERLSAVPEAEQCGWLKDKYGVSWQITPTVMDTMMAEGTPEQINRVTQAFLPMKKFDIAALERAYQRG